MIVTIHCFGRTNLLDSSLVDTSALVDQVTGGGRLTRVDVCKVRQRGSGNGKHVC